MAAELQSILLKKTYRLVYQIILLITNYFTILFWSVFHQYEQKGTTLSNSYFCQQCLSLQGTPMSLCCMKGTINTLPVPKLEQYWGKVGRVNSSLSLPETPLSHRGEKWAKATSTVRPFPAYLGSRDGLPLAARRFEKELLFGTCVDLKQFSWMNHKITNNTHMQHRV